MYNVTELYELERKPLRGKITLKLLLDYYEKYLHPFEYCYTLSDGNIINLRFGKKDMCHLLGIETIAKVKYNNDSQLKRYRGYPGYKRIETGEIDFKHLRNLSKDVTNNVKDKTLNFNQIPHIILSPKAVFRYKKISGTNIVCEFMMYDLKHGACVHLGIEKDDSGEFYFARSFWIERNANMKFVDDQDDEVIVEMIEQINLSNNELVTSLDLK